MEEVGGDRKRVREGETERENENRSPGIRKEVTGKLETTEKLEKQYNAEKRAKQLTKLILALGKGRLSPPTQGKTRRGPAAACTSSASSGTARDDCRLQAQHGVLCCNNSFCLADLSGRRNPVWHPPYSGGLNQEPFGKGYLFHPETQNNCTTIISQGFWCNPTTVTG